MARTKGANEVFCRSCGDAIKAQAETCPHCGVRNAAQADSSATRPQKSQPSTHSRSSSSQRNDESFLDEHGTTLSWIAGVFVLLAALGALTTIGTSVPRALFGGAMMMAASFITLPPTREYIVPEMEAQGLPTTRGILAIIALVLLFVGVGIAPS